LKILGLICQILFTFCTAVSAYAAEVPDTHGNRLAAARSYLEVASMREMVKDMIAETAKNLPEKNRQIYIKYMTDFIRVDVLESAAQASMARHFTLKELNALTAFYSSAEGRSAMKKFGAYMGDVMPVIQKEFTYSQRQLEEKFSK
jgi:hypothetical protein